MKLVLTSGGISNKSIEDELKKFIHKDFKDLKLLFCTTASNYDGGEMNGWLIEDIEYFKKLGFKIDICDINGVMPDRLLSRFLWADIFYFEGGNTQWLRKSFDTSGLIKYLDELLETRIWIGASAGSCVVCPTLCNSCQDLFDENIEGFPTYGLNLVDFQVVPHLNNLICPKINKDNLIEASKHLKRIDGRKVYVLDDNSALFVNGDNVKLVSEGEYLELNNE